MKRIYLISLFIAFFCLPKTALGQNKIIRFSSIDSTIKAKNNFVLKWNSITDTNIFFKQNDSTRRPEISPKGLIFDGLNDKLEIDSMFDFKSCLIICNYNDSNFHSFSGLLSGISSGFIFVGNQNTTNFNSGGSYGGNIKINGTYNLNFTPLIKFKTILGLSSNFLNYQNLQIGQNRVITGRNWKGKVLEVIFFDFQPNAIQIDSLACEIKKDYRNYFPISKVISEYSFCADSTILETEFFSIISLNNQKKTLLQNQKLSVTFTDFGGNLDTAIIEYDSQSPKQLSDSTICDFSFNYSWSTQMPHSYNFLWQDGSTDSVLTITQPGDYWVQVTDSFGCSITSDTVHIAVDSFAVKASLGNDRNLCQGNRLELQQERNKALHYQWSTGDTLPFVTIQNPGTYAVTTTNALGCIARDTVTIGIKGLAPTPLFSAQNACLGNTIAFSDLSLANSGNITQWLWDFGDGSTDTTQNPTHLYLDTGYYEVNLTILTDSGCEASFRDTVMVYPPPVANFTTSTSCQNLNTFFTDNSSSPWDSVVNWSYNFGDGNSAATQHPQHIYSNAQNFSVQLFVTNSFGCSDSSLKQIRVKPSPTANFNYSAPCVQDTVSITQTASGAATSAFQYTLWNGFTFNGSTFSNVFNQTGNYQVQLLVTDTNTCFDTITKTIAIRNHPQIINQLNDTIICLFDTLTWSVAYSKNHFSFQWQNGSTDSLFHIQAAGNYFYRVTDSVGCSSVSNIAQVSVNHFPSQVSLGADTSLCASELVSIQNNPAFLSQVLWNTSDSTTSIAIDTSGNYSVVLADTMHCVGTDTFFVLVRGEAAQTNFSFDTTCILDSTQFYDLSLLASGDTIVSWQWNFGNNLSDTIQNPKTYFPAIGSYVVSLQTITNDFCISETTDTITIHPLPQPQFSASFACQNREIIFTNQSTTATGSITNSLWRFNDALQSTDTAKNTSFIYDSAATYIVQLEAENSWGCKNATAQNLKVESTPEAQISAQNICFGEVANFVSSSKTQMPATYFWDFGDSIQSQGLQTQHLYKNTGAYLVSLLVTHQNSCKDTTSISFEVYPNPIAKSFSDSTCIHELFVYHDTSISANYPLNNWVWKTNNNVIDTGKTFQFSESRPFTYPILLTVSNAVGCKDSVSNLLKVVDRPTANFNYLPTFGAAPITIDFFNLSSSNGNNTWMLIDSIFSVEKEPEFTFLQNGTYNIQLIHINAAGCADSIAKNIKILPPVFDLALRDVSYQVVENRFLQAGFTVTNSGTQTVRNFEIILEIETGQKIKQMFEETILPGQSLNLNFASQLELPATKNFGFICAEIASVEGKALDDNLTNNKVCLSQESFVVREIFPNPSSNIINIQVIVGETDELNIMVFNSQGEEMMLTYNGQSNIGLNFIALDVSELPAGMYYARVFFKGNKIVKGFIVGK